jgi:hypothetical protein
MHCDDARSVNGANSEICIWTMFAYAPARG